MQHLFANFKIEEKKTIKSERAYVLSQFVEEINKERASQNWVYKKGDKWVKLKPVTGRIVAIKLGLLKTNQDLYEFLAECRDYKFRNGSFAKRFFGKLDLTKTNDSAIL